MFRSRISAAAVKKAVRISQLLLVDRAAAENDLRNLDGKAPTTAHTVGSLLETGVTARDNSTNACDSYIGAS